MTIVKKALEFAAEAHKGQVRKYTGEPYIVHPIEVMELVKQVTDDPKMQAAALLHDVVEDTPVSIKEIKDEFGPRVAALVSDLTDVSKPEDGNRALRKELDRQHTAKASPDAKTVKLADLISNGKSIIKDDPNFAKVFMKEKAALLDVMTEGNIILFKQASDMVASYFDNRP
jgi:(p)ppGpp synthase/HD superfamily hydrolase